MTAASRINCALPHTLNHTKPTTYSPPKSLHTNHSQYPPSPLNCPIWTVAEIARAVNGRIIKWGPPGTICTDTRTIEPNQWFFAVTGERFDGHDFITPELSIKGCVGVIGNRVCQNWDMGFVQIEGSTVDSLMNLACFVRNNNFSGGSVIGITGSVGKTTTKTMIASALDSVDNNDHVVFQSCRNWNNRIGVALSLIGAPRNAEVLVLEMGMSGKGEILELARVARPTIRVVLNVGAAHLENFGSLEEVALAKGEILREAMPGDVCVLNADDPLVMSLPVPRGVKKVFFGRRMGCDVRLVVAESVDGGLGVRVVLEKDKEMVEFVIPCPGLHLALNSCAAAAVATLLCVSLPQVGMSLSRFTPVNMRLELEVARNGIKIVNDVYNANPVSAKAAIDSLNFIDCNGKRVAILADMLELGPTEIESHENILRHCFDTHIKLVGLVGRRFLTAARRMNLTKEMTIVHACDAESLALKIVNMLSCNDVVLVKGSRGMKMEIVVDAIKAMQAHILRS